MKANPQTLKLAVPFLALLAGAALHLAGVFDARTLLRIVERFADYWWLPLAIVAAQALLFATAWPGSIFYWVAGTLYEPLYATVLIVAGGTAGSVAAYGIARRLKGGAALAKPDSKSLAFLARHSGFAELCAIRSFPNFPHAVINYGAAYLGVPLPRFIASTILGFAAKGFLYSAAIHAVTEAKGDLGEVGRKTLLPLLGLALLFVAGQYLQKIARKKNGSD